MMRWIKLDVVAPLLLVAAVAGIVLYSLPTRESLTQRKNLLPGVTLGRETVEAVKRHQLRTGAWPESLEAVGIDPARADRPYVRRLMLGDGGAVRVLLTGDPKLEGRSLIFDFIDVGGQPIWRCRAPGIPNPWLPEMCWDDALEAENG